jgi:hypothetical protein
MEAHKPVSVVPFDSERLPSVARFSEFYWSRPRAQEFYQWRYLECAPFSRMVLAMQADVCVGMIFALQKRYLIEGAPVSCLEVFDWHVVPWFKGSGAGLRLMRAMMRMPERLLSIGGTADVHSTLPAMGWQKVASAKVYELRLSGKALAEAVQRRTRLPRILTERPLDFASRLLLRPQTRNAPPLAAVVEKPAPDTDVLQLYEQPTGYDVLQVPDLAVCAWLAANPASACIYKALHFVIDGRLRGWAWTRVYAGQSEPEAAILEIFAPQPTVELYTWMVSVAAASVLPCSPGIIRARASCPMLQAALDANRFRVSQVETPVYTWPGKFTAGASVHITMNHSDEPLRPYRRGMPPGTVDEIRAITQ